MVQQLAQLPSPPQPVATQTADKGHQLQPPVGLPALPPRPAAVQPVDEEQILQQPVPQPVQPPVLLALLVLAAALQPPLLVLASGLQPALRQPAAAQPLAADEGQQLQQHVPQPACDLLSLNDDILIHEIFSKLPRSERWVASRAFAVQIALAIRSIIICPTAGMRILSVGHGAGSTWFAAAFGMWCARWAPLAVACGST